MADVADTPHDHVHEAGHAVTDLAGDLAGGNFLAAAFSFLGLLGAASAHRRAERVRATAAAPSVEDAA